MLCFFIQPPKVQTLFEKRFMLMNKPRNYFLKDDAPAEKLVALYRRRDIREVSLC